MKVVLYNAHGHSDFRYGPRGIDYNRLITRLFHCTDGSLAVFTYIQSDVRFSDSVHFGTVSRLQLDARFLQ